MQPHPPSVVVKFWDAEEGKWGMPHRLADFSKRALTNRGAAWTVVYEVPAAPSA